MNKQEYERIAGLVNQEFPIPTDQDIEETIAKIEARLAEKLINKFVNASVKEGYAKSIEILRLKQLDYSGIEVMKHQQARAIAMITVDYLNGQCSQEVLCGVPLK